MKLTASSLALASLLLLSGCSQEAQQSKETSSTAPRQAPVALPDGFFLTEPPANALPLAQARANAKPGDAIAFTGYIGGREAPFTEGRAVFLVADIEKVPPCTDGCPVPWDACCVPGDTISANSASVQVVGTDGQALRLGLHGQNGLAPGSQVTVVGKVREANASVLIVDATGIALAAATP